MKIMKCHCGHEWATKKEKTTMCSKCQNVMCVRCDGEDN